MHPLKAYIARYVRISDEEFELLLTYTEVVQLEKKLHLLCSGQICRHKYFLLEGLVRVYIIDDNGHENITMFGKEHWWVTDIDSFVHESPSQMNIQALEKTTALAIDNVALEEVYNRIPLMERFFRIITEKWLIAQLRNNNFYMKANSKERYYALVNSIPDFVQRVPQYMIASYLDITPEYLSEIRKSVKG